MTQPVMFDGNGTPTPEAQASGAVAAECSAAAWDKVSVKLLREATEYVYRCAPLGLTADEAVYRLRLLRYHYVDALSIRPRVTELKAAGILVETGKRRKNAKGNSCAVLIHRDVYQSWRVEDEERA